MKTFFLRYKRLHLWLLADLCLLAAFFVLRPNRPLMNALAEQIVLPLRRALGRLCYRVDFSVMEALCVLAVLAVFAYLVWSGIAIRRAGERWRGRAYSALLGAVCTGGLLYGIFCFLWGISFWTDGFQEQSGIYAQPVEQADLLQVTEYFAGQVSAASEQVARNEQGFFAVPREEILAAASVVYDPLEREFPLLTFDDPGVKPMFFSRLMSWMDFTGVYCSFTGESNVNVDSPACLLPATVAHELAHQRGYASEQECNFLAVLAATASGIPAYEYAGWLMGYIYLGNALYRVDPDRYWAIRETLPEGVRLDLAYNNAYWDQFRDNVVQTVSTTVYDGMLKAYGDERGMQSYGTVVDLLVAYYKT